MTGWMARLWRVLLRAYPAEFRCEYDQEMTHVLEDRLTEPGVARHRLFFLAAADVALTAPREHAQMILRDLRSSYRRLLAQPVFTAVAVFSLALGIGANTTVFSVVYSALLRPLPYPESERRVVAYTQFAGTSNYTFATTADFIDWRAASRSLEDWHMFSYRSQPIVVGASLPEPVNLQHVTPGLLESLGARPVIGRFFEPGEEAERPLLISEGYWRRRFGGQSGVLGRKLQVGDGIHTVIGVVPAGFELFDSPSAIDCWNTIDLSSPASNWVQRRVPWLMATAKLRPGVGIGEAQAEMTAIAQGLAASYPETNARRGVRLASMHEARNGNAGVFLYPLFGAVGFVLLIACTNVANLLLARAAARRREISVRAVLGAGRGLIREFLADGVALALPAVMGAIALAHGGILLFRALAPEWFPGLGTLELNAPVLWFTLAAGFLASVLCSAFPALEGSRAELSESLKEGARGSGGRRRQRLRSALVSGEVALALVLLAGAGLLIGSLFRLQSHDPGFDPKNVTVAQLNLQTGSRYMKNAPQREIDMRLVQPAVPLFFEHVLREAFGLPGVEAAALAGFVPMTPGGAMVSVQTAGAAEPEGGRARAQFNMVTDGYFQILRIPLRRGRYLDERDTESAPWVAVVNEAFVRQFFPEGDAIGQVLALGAGIGEKPREIVGVIADHTQFTPRMPPQPEVFASYWQQVSEIPGTLQGPRLRPKLILRSSTTASGHAEAIRKIVAGFDPDLPVLDVRTIEDHIARRGDAARLLAYPLLLFAAIAVLLAAVGVYGLMNYSVADRMHEIGIRLSLGARPGQIVWLVVYQGLRLALFGVAAGLAGALLTTRLLQSFLFGVEPWDPGTFALVTSAILGVALAACAIPARRASRVDPLIALRQE